MPRTQIDANQARDEDFALQGELNTLSETVAAKQDALTGAASTITNENLPASRVVITDANGKISYSAATATQLSALVDGGQTTLHTHPGSGGQSAFCYTTTIYAMDWIASGGRYYKDVVHALNSLDLSTHFFWSTSGATVMMDDIERIDANTLRVWSATNTEDIRVLVSLASVSRFAVTISSWLGAAGAYYSDIVHSLGTTDLLVFTFTPADNKEVLMDEIVRLDANTLRIYSATNTESVRVSIISCA